MAAVTGIRSLAEGKSPLRGALGAGMAFAKEKVKGIFGGGKGGGEKLKVTKIAESVDVGVPVRVAYNQWTQYGDFPKFTKKVEHVGQDKNEENKTRWKAQVFWSHRTWEAAVIEQVPDDRIIWRSTGAKGHVDGAVTFHQLAPTLTRILLVLQYHPRGLFERTGNLWRAQGRRARLERKHFRRHMMTQGILRAGELEGWRGTIHDGEVAESHDDALAREEQEEAQQGESRREESRRDADGRPGEVTRGRAGPDEAGGPGDGYREEEPDEEEEEELAPTRGSVRRRAAGRQE